MDEKCLASTSSKLNRHIGVPNCSKTKEEKEAAAAAAETTTTRAAEKAAIVVGKKYKVLVMDLSTAVCAYIYV